MNIPWRNNIISFTRKFKLYKPLVISVLYGCEKWTLLPDSEEGIQASETKRLRKLLRISSLGAQDQ